MEEVSASVVLVVVVEDVGGGYALHDVGYGFAYFLEEEMDVIAHLTVGIDGAMWWKRVALCIFFLEGLGSEDLEESLVVFGALEDLLLVYATEDGVIDSCVGLLSCCSWHVGLYIIYMVCGALALFQL